VDGNYTEAFSLALKSLEQFQQLNDTSLIMVKVLGFFGNICARTQNTRMAIDYYRQALALTEPGQKEYYSASIVLYTNLTLIKEEEKAAVDSLLSLLPVIEQRQDPDLLVSIYFNLGSIFINRGELEKGYSYFLTSKEYAKKFEFDNQSFIFMSNCNLSMICEFRKDYDEAFKYANIAKAAAINNNNMEQLSRVLNVISNIYKQTNNIDSAYHYLSEYEIVQQKIRNNSKTLEIYKDYISIYLESMKKELTIAEQDIAIKNRRLILTATVALVVILLLIILLQKRRSMTKRMEQEKQIQELQKDKIEMQVREITSYSVLLSNKNQARRQVSELVLELPVTGKNSETEIKQKISDIIKNNLNSDSERDNFMLHFDKVHPSFFKKLKERCGDLTENNLHLCAYFRIGMSSKQIAQILNVSFDTVRSNRYRLRKKLGLEENDNLYDFLRNI